MNNNIRNEGGTIELNLNLIPLPLAHSPISSEVRCDHHLQSEEVGR